jgi:hypothetical protein
MRSIYKLIFCCFCFFILLVQACKEPSLEVHIKRFDTDLLKPANATNPSFYPQLAQNYIGFYDSYCIDLLGIDSSERSVYFAPSLKGFIAYPGIQMLKHEVDSVFPNLDFLEADLGKAMYRYQKEFPESKVPSFVAFISEFGYAHVTYDSIIGIGLDMYLGSNYPIYKAPSIEFPDFMVNKLRKEYILPNTLKAIGIGRFEPTLSDKRFIAMMLFEGKLRYFVKQLAPQLADTLLFGYSKSQLDWCKQNEGMVWKHLSETNLLFSTEVAQYMRYLNDGPFTIATGVPQESAPAMAVYTGYRVIEAFVKKTDMSLQELMEFKDWDKILRESGYRPN